MTRASVCADAIRRAGAVAIIPGREDKPFFASLQPSFNRPDSGLYPEGSGILRGFDLYIPCDENAAALSEGDSILWMGCRYRVLRLERQCLDGEEILRRGTAVKEQEGGNP